eukprot:CCRYP_012377-RA/>CCRYP_012377-RA protein AED:0.39 eAED:0.39 QI:0/-1/0/1/-1/1/1/0/373
MLSIDVIGDSFVDFYCYLESGLPSLGGDSRLTEPIHTVAGGSALNTATHLSSLIRYFSDRNGSDESVRLQTVVNENDVYGKLIIDHAAQHNFKLINRRISDFPSCFLDPAQVPGLAKSTGHCTVIVANGDRSFMTHLGCMEDFRGSHILANNTSPKFNEHHVHIAGYFNIPGFWNGELANQLAVMQENMKKENKRLTISLVPQQDASNNWDGGLKDVLKYIDILILNETEAKCITGCMYENHRERCDKQIADCFYKWSPNTYVVVTSGPKGASVFRAGDMILDQRAPRVVTNPVDPTGAGDAFAAGFMYGLLDTQRNDIDKNRFKLDDMRKALQWGCAMGTCDVMIRGASTPCPKQNIEILLKEIKCKEDASN